MMEELKPCPFCGGEAEISEGQQNTQPPTPLKYVECLECESTSGMYKTEKEAEDAWNLRSEPPNNPLTLKQLKQMERQPVWICDLIKPELSRWHFIVRTEQLGLIAKDGLGQFERHPHNENKMIFGGCYYDIEHGNNYRKTWLAFCRPPEVVDEK